MDALCMARRTSLCFPLASWNTKLLTSMESPVVAHAAVYGLTALLCALNGSSLLDGKRSGVAEGPMVWRSRSLHSASQLTLTTLPGQRADTPGRLMTSGNIPSRAPAD